MVSGHGPGRAVGGRGVPSQEKMYCLNYWRDLQQPPLPGFRFRNNCPDSQVFFCGDMQVFNEFGVAGAFPSADLVYVGHCSFAALLEKLVPQTNNQFVVFTYRRNGPLNVLLLCFE